MGLANFSIYKYVKSKTGWRYCKPAYSTNNKIRPHGVLVGGKKEAHPEVAYYPNLNGQSQKVEVTAERLPEPERREELLSDAIARSLEELNHKVAGKTGSKRHLWQPRLLMVHRRSKIVVFPDVRVAWQTKPQADKGLRLLR